MGLFGFFFFFFKGSKLNSSHTPSRKKILQECMLFRIVSSNLNLKTILKKTHGLPALKNYKNLMNCQPWNFQDTKQYTALLKHSGNTAIQLGHLFLFQHVTVNQTQFFSNTETDLPIKHVVKSILEVLKRSRAHWHLLPLLTNQVKGSLPTLYGSPKETKQPSSFFAGAWDFWGLHWIILQKFYLCW